MAVTSRGPVSTAGLAIFIAVIGGCAVSEPLSTDGAPSATTAATLSPSDEVGATPPITSDPDAAALAKTDPGAAEFVSRWFVALNDDYVAGRLGGTASLSGPDCTACADYEADLASLVVAGGRTASPPFSIRDVRATGADTGVAVVTLTYEVVGTTVHRPGSAAELRPGSPAGPARAAVVWTGSGWQMGEIGL